MSDYVPGGLTDVLAWIIFSLIWPMFFGKSLRPLAGILLYILIWLELILIFPVWWMVVTASLVTFVIWFVVALILALATHDPVPYNEYIPPPSLNWIYLWPVWVCLNSLLISLGNFAQRFGKEKNVGL